MSKKSASATLNYSPKSTSEDLERALLFPSNVSYRKIPLAKIRLICHSSAKEAYLAWESLPKRLQENISYTHLKSYLFNSPIFLTKENDSAESNKHTYYYFDNFEQIQYLNSCKDDFLTIPILLVQQPDPKHIERMAWLELGKLIFNNTLDSQMGSACLLSAINNMPTDILNLLFGSLELSVSDFRELNGLSQSQYDNQLKKWRAYQKLNQKPDVQVSFTSILSQINAKN